MEECHKKFLNKLNMALKQIKENYRILFLKKFISELIINSAEDEITKKQIEKEKIKKRLLSSFKEDKPKINLKKNLEHKKLIHRIRIPQTNDRLVYQTFQETPKLKTNIQKNDILKNIYPESHPKPRDFTLGKIEQLLKDPFIQSIECPGPGKNILIKKYNKINITKIVLTKFEINEIINNFSKQAKIPIIGGILKAAVGNLIISAVVSKFVGSRFIINKIPNIKKTSAIYT